MPFNGSGGFTRNQDWTADRDAGSPNNIISATKMDDEDDNFKGGFEACLTRSGENSPTNNLPMNAKKHTNVADAAALNEYSSAGQLQGGKLNFGGTSSGTDAVTFTLTPTLTSYVTGQAFSFFAGGTNTTAVTVDIDSVGVKAVQKNGVALVAGDITANDIVLIEYDGTQFQMLSPARTPVLTAASIAAASIITGTSGAAIPLLDGDNVHSGTNEFDKVVIWSKGADVASAAALPVLTDGNYFDVTGTTTITSIDTLGVGTTIKLHFDDALILTHNASSLVLPSGANITTAAGDEAEFTEESSGNWRCTNYSKADGTAVVTNTQAEAKAWVNFNGTGTVAIRDSFNVSSITDNGTGDYTVNLTTAMSNTNYCVVSSFKDIDGSSNAGWGAKVGTYAVGSFRLITGADGTTSSALSDTELITAVVFGDQ